MLYFINLFPDQLAIFIVAVFLSVLLYNLIKKLLKKNENCNNKQDHGNVGNKSEPTTKQDHNMKKVVCKIVVFLSCLFFSFTVIVSLLLFINFILKSASNYGLAFDSNLDYKDVFSNVIGILTLILTVIIAVIQYRRAQYDKLEDNRQRDLQQKIEDDKYRNEFIFKSLNNYIKFKPCSYFRKSSFNCVDFIIESCDINTYSINNCKLEALQLKRKGDNPEEIEINNTTNVSVEFNNNSLFVCVPIKGSGIEVINEYIYNCFNPSKRNEDELILRISLNIQDNSVLQGENSNIKWQVEYEFSLSFKSLITSDKSLALSNKYICRQTYKI